MAPAPMGPAPAAAAPMAPAAPACHGCGSGGKLSRWHRWRKVWLCSRACRASQRGASGRAVGPRVLVERLSEPGAALGGAGAATEAEACLREALEGKGAGGVLHTLRTEIRHGCSVCAAAVPGGDWYCNGCRLHPRGLAFQHVPVMVCSQTGSPLTP